MLHVVLSNSSLTFTSNNISFINNQQIKIIEFDTTLLHLSHYINESSIISEEFT